MAKLGRIFYNLITGIGFALVFVFFFLFLYVEYLYGFEGLATWEKWTSIAALVVAGVGIVSMVISIILFFRRVEGMIFSHIFFVLMLLDLTYAILLYKNVI